MKEPAAATYMIVSTPTLTLRVDPSHKWEGKDLP